MWRDERGGTSWEELLARLESRLSIWESSVDDGTYPDDFDWPPLEGDLPPRLEGRARRLLSRYHLIEGELTVRREVLKAALDGLNSSAPSGRPAGAPLFVDSHV